LEQIDFSREEVDAPPPLEVFKHQAFCFSHSVVKQYCIGFTWQDFDSRGAAEVSFVRRHQKLPPCLTEEVSAGSKVDSLLAKAEPISNVVTVSVTTYLRRGNNTAQLQLKEGSENM